MLYSKKIIVREGNGSSRILSRGGWDEGWDVTGWDVAGRSPTPQPKIYRGKLLQHMTIVFMHCQCKLENVEAPYLFRLQKRSIANTSTAKRHCKFDRSKLHFCVRQYSNDHSISIKVILFSIKLDFRPHYGVDSSTWVWCDTSVEQ